MAAIQAKLYKHSKMLDKQLKGWIVEHLIKLSPEDRRMRFFHAVRDDGLKSYLDKISKDDEIFITMDTISGSMKVTGFLHVAALGDGSYEIGVTVDADHRKSGIAGQLFDRALMFLKGNGCKKLYINCLSSNTAMQKIVKRYKMDVKRDKDDPTTSTAVVEMNQSADFYSWLKGSHQDHIALYDLLMGSFKKN